ARGRRWHGASSHHRRVFFFFFLVLGCVFVLSRSGFVLPPCSRRRIPIYSCAEPDCLCAVIWVADLVYSAPSRQGVWGEADRARWRCGVVRVIGYNPPPWRSVKEYRRPHWVPAWLANRLTACLS